MPQWGAHRATQTRRRFEAFKTRQMQRVAALCLARWCVGCLHPRPRGAVAKAISWWRVCLNSPRRSVQSCYSGCARTSARRVPCAAVCVVPRGAACMAWACACRLSQSVGLHSGVGRHPGCQVPSARFTTHTGRTGVAFVQPWARGGHGRCALAGRRSLVDSLTVAEVLTGSLRRP